MAIPCLTPCPNTQYPSGSSPSGSSPTNAPPPPSVVALAREPLLAPLNYIGREAIL